MPSRIQASEAEVLKSIMDYMAARKIPCFRRNTGATIANYQSKAGDMKRRFIRFSQPGMADLWGWFPWNGQHWECEVKRPGGKMTPEQAAWLQQARNGHCVAFMATSIYEVECELAKVEQAWRGQMSEPERCGCSIINTAITSRGADIEIDYRDCRYADAKAKADRLERTCTSLHETADQANNELKKWRLKHDKLQHDLAAERARVERLTVAGNNLMAILFQPDRPYADLRKAMDGWLELEADEANNGEAALAEPPSGGGKS